MRYRIRYRSSNGTEYYFVDLRSVGSELKPVGCFSYRSGKVATIFHSKKEAKKVFDYLNGLGYAPRLCSVDS